MDIIAAKTAARIRPAMKGWKRICERSRNTDSAVSGLVREASGWRAKYAIPMNAPLSAPNTVRTIQLMPMRRPDLASAGVRSAMKRTIMCGWPKYPRPQARDEIIPAKVVPAKMLRASGRTWLMDSTTGPTPPRSIIVTTGTAMSAASMSRP